ncbi:ABC transporter permease [Halocatena halophila]|uniref:ABC transporter permease n=1 Tax=Halocatena halophila TaxID=2814576 RepID=UPI002ED15548
MASKWFVIKRLLLLIPVLIGISTVVFAILHLGGNDPAAVMAGQGASQEQIETIRSELGFDDPIWVQYTRFLSDVSQFDFGESYVLKPGQPVWGSILADKLPVTIELAIYGQLFGVMLGVPLGVLSAIKQNSLTDHITRIGALAGISVPIFWSGPLLIILFANILGVLPASSRIDTQYFIEGPWAFFGHELPLTGLMTIDTLLLGNIDAFVSAVEHLLLPAAVMGIYSMALISRMMRSSMLEVVRQDYIRTARAKGQGQKITMLKHGLKNAFIPVITVIGIQFGTMLGGAVLTETVFGISGLGVILVNAIQAGDYPVVQAAVLVFAMLFTLVNLTVDITYSYLDPRIQQ